MIAPARQQRGILDTSTVILLPRIEEPAVPPEEPLITAITHHLVRMLVDAPALWVPRFLRGRRHGIEPDEGKEDHTGV